MTPDWPSLWEREPGLMPKFPGIMLIYDKNPLWMAMLDPYGQQPAFHDLITAALCRDAAVRWLLSLGDEWWYLKLAFDPTNKLFEVTRYVEMAGGESDIPHQSFDSPSLDAAIFASCAAALDDRDAKPNP